MLASLDVLSNAFPSPAARSLFHHYANYTSKILLTMGNKGPNPFLSLCTSLNLLDTSSPAAAAIRMSILSTSVAHLSFITEDIYIQHNPIIPWQVKKDALKRLSDKFKRAALSNSLLVAKWSAGTRESGYKRV
jgi:hypothetical protein